MKHMFTGYSKLVTPSFSARVEFRKQMLQNICVIILNLYK